MTPLTVFFRTLTKASAIFLGAGFIMLHPSLDLRARGPRTSLTQAVTSGFALTAQKSPPEAAVDGLVLALKDSDAGVRRQAASALGQTGSRRAVPGLIELLKDPLVDVRQHAISALAEIGDPSAAGP